MIVSFLGTLNDQLRANNIVLVKAEALTPIGMESEVQEITVDGCTVKAIVVGQTFTGTLAVAVALAHEQLCFTIEFDDAIQSAQDVAYLIADILYNEDRFLQLKEAQ